MMHLLARLFAIAVMTFIWFGLIMAVHTAVAAEPVPCAKTAKVTEDLSTNYQEAPIAHGLAASGAIMRLWSSPDGATWTITYTFPNGVTCLMSAGEALDLLQLQPPQRLNSGESWGSLFTLAHEWIERHNFRNINGILCCNWTDCAPISVEEAWTKGVGSTVIIPLITGPQAVVINTVHPTYDPDGKPWACLTGCLFRASGY